MALLAKACLGTASIIIAIQLNGRKPDMALAIYGFEIEKVERSAHGWLIHARSTEGEHHCVRPVCGVITRRVHSLYWLLAQSECASSHKHCQYLQGELGFPAFGLGHSQVASTVVPANVGNAPSQLSASPARSRLPSSNASTSPCVSSWHPCPVARGLWHEVKPP